MDLTQFHTYPKESGRAEKTVDGYITDMELFARWFAQSNGEELTPQNLTPTDIREYRQYMMSIKKAKPATINRHLSAIRAFANWGKTIGAISYSPAENSKSIAQQSQAPKWLDKKEQAALIREVEKRVLAARTEPAIRQAARDQAILVILLNTGVRVSELVGLELSDVTVMDRKGEIRVRAGKAPRREIPLNARARKAILDYLRVRPEIESEFLFLGQRNEAVQSKTVQRAVTRFTQVTDLKEVTPHTLRHTFAKSLIDSGVSLDKVATLLGHSNLNTTRIYTTPGVQDLEDAIGELDNY